MIIIDTLPARLCSDDLDFTLNYDCIILLNIYGCTL